MDTINVSTTFADNFIAQSDIDAIQFPIIRAMRQLSGKMGEGNEFLGWLSLPDEIDNKLIDKIQKDAAELRSKSDVFIVVGIGGSYLGARAVIEALKSVFDNDDSNPQIIYAGNHLSEDYMYELLKYLDNKDYTLAVISKSGTTTEPAIAFRLLKEHIEKKYGKQEAQKRIIAITDKAKGALKNLAVKENYKTYVIPDDVGGRFSVLTPVGLFPIAVAGYDIKKLIQGACNIKTKIFSNENSAENICLKYAATRNVLYKNGKKIEILVNYEPKLAFFSEWWKQLYGESEGKKNKGIFPASVNFTTDLHSMGQYIQDGERILFETVLKVTNNQKEVKIPVDTENLDGLNFLADKRIGYINEMALLGTVAAHVEGKVPNILIEIPEISEYYLGQLIYFFEFACGISGYALGVNPFDQPGVENYKKNMFELLGKE